MILNGSNEDENVTIIDSEIIDIHVGDNFVILLSKNDTIYGYGDNSYQQLDETQNKGYWKELKELNYFKQEKIKIIKCCKTFTVVLTERNNVYQFGKRDPIDNLYGQRYFLMKFENAALTSEISSISCGKNAICYLLNDGKVILDEFILGYWDSDRYIFNLLQNQLGFYPNFIHYINQNNLTINNVRVIDKYLLVMLSNNNLLELRLQYYPNTSSPEFVNITEQLNNKIGHKYYTIKDIITTYNSDYILIINNEITGMEEIYVKGKNKGNKFGNFGVVEKVTKLNNLPIMKSDKQYKGKKIKNILLSRDYIMLIIDDSEKLKDKLTNCEKFRDVAVVCVDLENND